MRSIRRGEDTYPLISIEDRPYKMERLQDVVWSVTTLVPTIEDIVDPRDAPMAHLRSILSLFRSQVKPLLAKVESTLT